MKTDPIWASWSVCQPYIPVVSDRQRRCKPLDDHCTWAFTEKDLHSFYSDFLHYLWLVGSASGCCWAEKHIFLVRKLNYLWLLLSLKCPVIWSYQRLASALSHWKIKKLLVAYPPSPSLAILAHYSSVNFITVIIMIIILQQLYWLIIFVLIIGNKSEIEESIK